MKTDCRVSFVKRETAEIVPFTKDPAPLSARGIRGKTLATLISPGTELACYQGLLEGSVFPINPGYATVFVVKETGSEVQDIKQGDIVFCEGAHQSFQRTIREHVVPVPPGLSPFVAVFVRLMGVSMSTMVTTTARPPAPILISGLGPVGYLAAQIFTRCGYTVTACEPDIVRQKFAASAGINVVASIPDEWKNGGIFDLVVECSGYEGAAIEGCKVVRKRGEVVLVGVPWKRRTDIFAHELLNIIFHRYAVVRSGWEWELPRTRTEFRNGNIFENYESAMKWLAEGSVRVEGIYEKMSPACCQEAYQGLLHKTNEKLTVVFDWTEI
ncbi:MAG: zinc-binding alcohol dehydrogenase [Candidatus Zixiibacteriota bacterium]